MEQQFASANTNLTARDLESLNNSRELPDVGELTPEELELLRETGITLQDLKTWEEQKDDDVTHVL